MNYLRKDYEFFLDGTIYKSLRQASEATGFSVGLLQHHLVLEGNKYGYLWYSYKDHRYHLAFRLKDLTGIARQTAIDKWSSLQSETIPYIAPEEPEVLQQD